MKCHWSRKIENFLILHLDPDIAEVSREKRIKESIVNELSAVLKSIQATQQNRPGEPVYTSDASTQLCNVFEAVFLHGNKTCHKLRSGEFDTQSLERCVSIQSLSQYSYS